MMKLRIASIAAAVLLAGAAALFPAASWAGSCCGGGSAASLIVPKYARSVADISFDTEIYHGFWNQNWTHTPDPPGSDLRQYRVNFGFGQRLGRNWQASVIVPYVWNVNQYSGLSSRTNGLGDATLNLWYEALDDVSAWRVRGIKDLVPSVMIGPSIVIPTGYSPYDDIASSFDVTGRGFYRVDGNLLIEKTIQPWGISASLSYGTYIERSVNREYGKYVEPYKKKLGDRTSASVSLSYNYFIGSGGDTLTPSISYSYLNEADGRVNEADDSSTSFRKQAVGGGISFSGTDRDWSVRASWSHAIREDGWGKNFPTTDIFTVGVRYVFR
ncbi:MAG: hypothetical protein M0Z60_13855 [Nitrospiraceae bacterium]|nr:hypothetical protein [Nitrospiraceae bacterium]